MVETGNLPAKPIDMAVSYSNFDAARAMTGHLGRLGYRRIGFVTLPLRDNDRSRERRRGYFAALKELGLPADPGLVLEAPGGFAEGADALVRLVQTHPDIDACFFAGDVLAVGACSNARGAAGPCPAASPSRASTTSTCCATPCRR